MISVHTLAYNEELLLPFFIDHYRQNFPGCAITVFDNQSTDGTAAIARKMDCRVITFETTDQYSETALLMIRNNCWRGAKTDWVAMVDCDELVAIKQADLIAEEQRGTTIFKCEGYDMVNTAGEVRDTSDLKKLTQGVRNTYYDKMVVFNKSKILNINYHPGCHNADPEGTIQYSSKPFRLFHYKYLGEKFLIDRYCLFNQRLSDENRKFGWGHHYALQENEIKARFQRLREKCTTVITP